MFKNYRLEVCSRFYFQLYILKRTNHTSLKYLLTEKNFTSEIKDYTDLVARPEFQPVWLHMDPHWSTSPPQAKTDTLVTIKCPWPLLKGSIATQQQALFWPSRLPIILTGNVKVHKLVLHDATSKWARNVLCCADLCPPRLQWSPKL